MDDEVLNGGNTPIEPPENTPPVSPAEAPESAGVEDVLAALDSVDVGEEPTPEAASGGESNGVKGVVEAEEELAGETIEFKAQVEAAMYTGGIAEVVERLLKPVQVTEEMRADFHGALYPVLMGHGGGVMPVWMAKLLEDWKAELILAKKTAAIGWAIYEQRCDIRDGKIAPAPDKKKRYRLPADKTTKRAAA